MKTIVALGLAVLLLTGSSARKPVDVPPLLEEYGNPGHNFCDMGKCTFMEGLDPFDPNDKGQRRTRITCADKTRFLMTSEDGMKHCIAITD